VDTIEDLEKDFDISKKASLIDTFIAIFEDEEKLQSFKDEMSLIQISKEYDRVLVLNVDHVFRVFNSLLLKTQKEIKRWVQEMALGMKGFVLKYPKGIRIKTQMEYNKYCYYVAGTVGHLLTQLWFIYSPCINKKIYSELKKLSEAFGQALQTTNILKDVYWDMKGENSIFIPEEILEKYGLKSNEDILNESNTEAFKKVLDAMIENALYNLKLSQEYIKLLPKLCPNIRLFCLLPYFLAIATLMKIKKESRIENRDIPIKLTRKELKRIRIFSAPAVFSNSWLSFYSNVLSR
jgi:farnesyl-diphosphate farnesyltransferase